MAYRAFVVEIVSFTKNRASVFRKPAASPLLNRAYHDKQPWNNLINWHGYPSGQPASSRERIARTKRRAEERGREGRRERKKYAVKEGKERERERAFKKGREKRGENGGKKENEMKRRGLRVG